MYHAGRLLKLTASVVTEAGFFQELPMRFLRWSARSLKLNQPATARQQFQPDSIGAEFHRFIAPEISDRGGFYALAFRLKFYSGRSVVPVDPE